MEDSRVAKGEDRTDKPAPGRGGGMLWLLLGLGALLIGWGVAANWRGVRLEAAARLGKIHLQREPGTAEPLEELLGAEVVKPFERVVGLASNELGAGDERLVDGLSDLRTLTLKQSEGQPPLDLAAVDWQSLGKLEWLDLTSEPLDLAAVDWGALTTLRELRLTSTEFRVPPEMQFPATLAKVHFKGRLQADLLTALANASELDRVALCVPKDLTPLPHWADGLHTMRTKNLVVLASPPFSTVPAEHVDWEGLGRLTGVETLQLNVALATPETLRQLSNANGLRELRLIFDAWQAGVNQPLDGFETLETLSLSQWIRIPPQGREFSGEAVGLLSNLPRLRSLMLQTPHSALRGDELLPLDRLQTLSISCRLTPDACRSIARLPRLESLSLSAADLTLDALAPLSRCRSLRRLSIAGTPAGQTMTDAWRQTHLPGVEVVTQSPSEPGRAAN